MNMTWNREKFEQASWHGYLGTIILQNVQILQEITNRTENYILSIKAKCNWKKKICSNTNIEVYKTNIGPSLIGLYGGES